MPKYQRDWNVSGYRFVDYEKIISEIEWEKSFSADFYWTHIVIIMSYIT